ncbi:MAG TPA: hypothetical protein VGH79_06380 [Gaiellaceae bacterium]|jgi:hypothetical protein
MTRIKKLALGVAALVGAAVGGAALAGAATSHTVTSTTPSGAGRPAPAAVMNMPAHGSAAHEDAEKAVTGDAATKAQAAAVKAAGGGTAGDVTTDYFGNGYEVTVTKSNGSTVEIHLDSAFNAMTGPPRGPGGRPGMPPPSSSSSNSSSGFYN